MDWDKIEESKKVERARLAALPIGEKFRLLEAMRRRAQAIKNGKRPAEKPAPGKGHAKPKP